MGLRVPVQQEQTGTCTALAVTDVHAVDVALVFLESGEHGMTPLCNCLHPGITQRSGQGRKRGGVVHEVCRSWLAGDEIDSVRW
jgi:hypothetical protein